VDWGTYSVGDVMDRCLFSCKLVLRKSLPISCWEFKTSDGGGSLIPGCVRGRMESSQQQQGVFIGRDAASIAELRIGQLPLSLAVPFSLGRR
jgi:hypothetical protein